jgi:hypothetical protein
VERPWWNQVRERVYSLAATRDDYRGESANGDPFTGDPTVWWIHPERAGEARVHDLASPDRLSHVEVTASAVIPGDSPTDHEMVVRVRAVDRARPAKYGAPLGEGLYAFDDGLRFRFVLLDSCAQGACRVFEAASALRSAHNRFYLDPTKAPSQWSGYTFAFKGAHVVVTH